MKSLYLTILFFLIIFITQDVISQAVYFSEKGTGKINKLLDGIISPIIDQSFSDLGPLAFDKQNQKLYFFGDNIFYQVNSNGSDLAMFNASYQPRFLNYNNSDKCLYWIDKQDDKIYKYNSATEVINPIFTSTIYVPHSFAIDEINSKLYFSDINNDVICKINLDGSNLEEIVSLRKVNSLTVNQYGNIIYWTDIVENKIMACNTDGMNITQVKSNILDLFAISYNNNDHTLLFSILSNASKGLYKINPDGSSLTSILLSADINTIIPEDEPASLGIQDYADTIFVLNGTETNSFKCYFSKQGIFAPGSSFIVELSDENGYFGNSIEIGSTSDYNSNFLNASIPQNLKSGNIYRLRMKSTGTVTYSEATGYFKIIENATPKFTNVALESATYSHLYVYAPEVVDRNQDILSIEDVNMPDWLTLKTNTTKTLYTLAGNAISGFKDTIAQLAEFNYPYGLVKDTNGNLFVSDVLNNCIRRITPNNEVKIYAGTKNAGYKNGSLLTAEFNFPLGICINSKNELIVADSKNHSIRRIDNNGIVTTIAGDGNAGYADGHSISAQFSNPSDVCVDALDRIYVADSKNNVIRMIDELGFVHTIAGTTLPGDHDGTSTTATFNEPKGIHIDRFLNIYIADYYNHKIRKISPDGIVSTIAGNGVPDFTDGSVIQSSFKYPTDVFTDSYGNLFVADYLNHSVRKITNSSVVSTFEGNGTPGDNYEIGNGAFKYPGQIYIDGLDNVYLTDQYNYKIKKIQQRQVLFEGVPGKSDIGDNNVTIKVFDGVSETEQSFIIKVYGLPPDIQAKDLTFYKLPSNSLQLNWINGNGSGRVVIARENQSVSFVPQDELLIENVNSDFSLATDQGNRNKFVFSGTANQCIVSGLESNKTYHFAIYEYNGQGEFSLFLRDNPARGNSATNSILIEPLSGSPYIISGALGNELTLILKSDGFFESGNIYTAYLSDKDGNFENEISIGNTYNPADNSLVVTLPSGIETGTHYQIRIKSSLPQIISPPSNPFIISSKIVPFITFVDGSITNQQNITAIVAFTEPVNGFELSDIAVVNGNAVSLSVVKPLMEFQVEIKAKEDNKNVSAYIPQGIVYNDEQQVNVLSEIAHIFYDTSSPVPAISTNTTSPSNADHILVSLKFSEAVSGFSSLDLASENTSVSEFTEVLPGLEWEIKLVTPENEIVKIGIPENVCTDAAGNPNNASNNILINIDHKSPFCDFIYNGDSITNNDTEYITVKFSEKVGKLLAANFQVLNCSIISFVEIIDSIEWKLKLKLEEGKINISISENITKDKAGNWNEKSEIEFYADLTKPTVSIRSLSGNPTNEAVVLARIVFSEQIISEFSPSLITVNNANVHYYKEVEEGRVWDLTLVPNKIGDIYIRIPEGKFEDESGNFNIGNELFIIYDLNFPTFEFISSNSFRYNSPVINFQIRFSEGIVSLKKNHIKIEENLGVATEISSDETARIWDIKLFASEPGELMLYIPAYSISDSAGNVNEETIKQVIHYDLEPPVCMVYSGLNKDTINIDPFPLIFHFNEPVINNSFILEDIISDDISISDFEMVSGDTLWTARAKIEQNKKVITLKFKLESISDLAGNLNNQDFSKTFFYDIEKPQLDFVFQGTGDTDIDYAVNLVFSEPVVGFVIEDLKVKNAGVSGLKMLSDTLYQLQINPQPSSTVVIEILENSLTDIVGNGNVYIKYEIPFGTDIIAPSVEFISDITDTTVTDFSIRVLFSEEIKVSGEFGFTEDKLLVTNARKKNFSEILRGKEFSVDIVPEIEGPVLIELPKSAVIDLHDNGNVDNKFEIYYRKPQVYFTLSNDALYENNEAGAEVGILEMERPYNDGSYEFGFVANNFYSKDNSLFVIENNILKTTISFNYEQEEQYFITIQAKGPQGNLKMPFIIRVNNENDPPIVNNFIQDYIVKDGRFLSISIADMLPFYDEDKNEVLEYRALQSNGQKLPDWITFYSDILVFYIQPPNGLSDTIEVSLRATDFYGEYADVNFLVISDGPTSIKGITNNTIDFEIYPNPANGLVNYSIENGKELNYTISLTDITGKTIKLSLVNADKGVLNCNNLAPGIYIIELFNSDFSIKKQLIMR